MLLTRTLVPPYHAEFFAAIVRAGVGQLDWAEVSCHHGAGGAGVCWYLLQPLAEFLRLRPSDMGAMNARCQFLFICERCACRPLLKYSCNSRVLVSFTEASARADATVQAAAARIFSGGGEQSSEVVRSVSAAAAEQERARAQAALEAAAGFESQARADDAELLQVNEAISEERRLSSDIDDIVYRRYMDGGHA